MGDNKKLLTHEETMGFIKEAQAGSQEAMDTLLHYNRRLIWNSVMKFKPSADEKDDIFQVGAIGFVKAIQKFDFNYSVRFSTYAVPMIVGEIQRHLRDTSGVIRVSRNTKEVVARMRAEGYEPTVIEDVMEKYELSKELAHNAMTHFWTPVVKSTADVFHSSDGDDLTIEDRLEGDLNPENWFDNIVLRDAIKQLDDRSQEIIRLIYFEERTQTEAADALGVSQVHVSRLLTKQIKLLRAIMMKEEAVDTAFTPSGRKNKEVASKDITEQIEQMLDEGITHTEIARTLRTSRGTIHRVAKDAGKLRPQGGGVRKGKKANGHANRKTKGNRKKAEKLIRETILPTPDIEKHTKVPAGTIRDMLRYERPIELADKAQVRANTEMSVRRRQAGGATLEDIKANVDLTPILEAQAQAREYGITYTFAMNLFLEGKAVPKKEAQDKLQEAIDRLMSNTGTTVSFTLDLTGSKEEQAI
jgi:RNA polymerase sporulation-specific sigma factor